MSASRIMLCVVLFGVASSGKPAGVAASEPQKPFTEQEYALALDFFSDGGIWSFTLDGPERAAGQPAIVLVLLDRKQRSKIKELALGSAESGGKGKFESALKVLDLYSRPRSTLRTFILKFADGVEKGDYSALMIKSPRFNGDKLRTDGAAELTKEQLLALFREAGDQQAASGNVAPENGSAAPAESEPEPLRTWVDQTGKYRTEARLVEFKNDQVQLKKKDGKLATIALDRLSAKDRQYILARFKQGDETGGDTRPSKPEAPSPTGEKPAASQQGTGWANVASVEIEGRTITPGDLFAIRPVKDGPLDAAGKNPRFELEWHVAARPERPTEAPHASLTVLVKQGKSHLELAEAIDFPKRAKKGKFAKSFSVPLQLKDAEIYLYFSQAALDAQNRLSSTVVSNIVRLEVK